MGKRAVDDASLSRVADAIRAKTGKAGEVVFPTGFEAGVSDVYNAGRNDERDYFWDEYQDWGLRTDYYCGFGGLGWRPTTFYPKHDMQPRNASYMFWYFGLNDGYTDLVERLEECGVTLDFSNCHTFTNAFAMAKISHLGVIDTTGAVSLNSIFREAYVTTIDKLILKAKQTFTNAFYANPNSPMKGVIPLRTIQTIEGEITNDIDLKQCPYLDKGTITRFFNRLSASVTGKTITFSKEAVNNAFTTEEWTALKAKKSNWTINLD